VVAKYRVWRREINLPETSTVLLILTNSVYGAIPSPSTCSQHL
jgi:hypothetical protein